MTHSARFARITGWLYRHRLPLLLVALLCFAIPATFVDAVVIDGAKAAISLFLSLLAYTYSVIAFALGKLIVILIGMIIIPILGYNDFGSSFIISIGWPLVRDVMNMFVILILILIAIKTILGIGGGVQAAQQNILKLFLAVVAMNFSRTICVLIIDFGQVVMMTFVNALQDIAAGNFVGLFQLNSFLSVNIDIQNFDADVAGPLSGGSNAVAYLGSAYLTLVLMAIVLGVISIIAVVFIYRIVILWVLTILSPLAFFLMGVPLEGAKGYASEWRKKFVGAVTLGPILTFFLWLALATAGQGSLVATEGFPTEGTEDTAGLLNDAFDTDRLLSLFIGILLLFVGLQAASGSASALGSFSGKAVKAGEQFGRWALTAPARGTYAAARQGVRQVEARTAKYMPGDGGVFSAMGRDIQKTAGSVIGSRAGQIPILGGALKGSARLIAGGGSAMERQMSEQFKERMTSARESLSKEGMDQRLAELRIWERDDAGQIAGEWTASEQAEQQARAAEYLSSGKQEKLDRKRLEGEGLNESEIDSVIQKKKRKMMGAVEPNLKAIYGGDDAAEDKVFKTKAANLHLLTDENDIKKIVGDRKFNLNLLGGDAVKDPRVQGVLEDTTVRTRKDKDGNVIRESYLDQVKAGRGSASVREAWQGKGADKTFIRGDVPAEHLANYEPAEHAAETAKWNAQTDAKAEMAGRAMRHGHMSVAAADLTTADLNGAAAGSTEIKSLAKALVAAGGNAKGSDTMDATIRANVVAELKGMKTAATTEVEKLDLDKVIARVEAPATNPSTHLDDYSASGDFTRTAGPGSEMTDTAKRSERVVREIIKEKATDIRRFDSAIPTNGSDTSRIIVDGTSKKAHEDFLRSFRAAMQSGNTAEAAVIKDATRTLGKALTAELRKTRTEITRIRAVPGAPTPANTARLKKLNERQKDLRKRDQELRYTEPLMRP